MGHLQTQARAFTEPSEQEALLHLAPGGLGCEKASHWCTPKMDLPPWLAASCPVGVRKPGSNWGKCLCWRQPVALQATALTQPPAGRGEEAAMLYSRQSQGSNSLGHQSKASLAMKKEPEHQAV